jgi:hypothetical protein
MSYIKTGDVENKISPLSLNKLGLREMGELWSNGWGWNYFFLPDF